MVCVKERARKGVGGRENPTSGTAYDSERGYPRDKYWEPFPEPRLTSGPRHTCPRPANMPVPMQAVAHAVHGLNITYAISWISQMSIEQQSNVNLGADKKTLTLDLVDLPCAYVCLCVCVCVCV